MSYNRDSITNKTIIKVTAIVLAVLVVILLAVVIFCSSMLGSDKIYDGISVSGENLGGLTQKEAAAVLSHKFEIDLTQEFTLICEEAEISFPVSEIEPVLDAESTASAAHAYARYGSVFSRLRQVFDLKSNPVSIPISVRFNEEALYVHTDKLTGEVGIPMEELSSSVSDGVLTVTRGKPGMEINRKTAKTLIAESLAEKKYSLKLSLEEVLPAEPTAEEIYNRFHADAKDATYTVVDNEIQYTESTTGIHFDRLTAKNAIDEADGAEISFPVTVIEPDVTVDDLKEKMFRDRLATYSSKYNEGVIGRSHNVKLAASNINGTILLPGQEFSYNDVVGPRTVERGFKEANVYVGDEVETGIGGGICQVSSTLFNSVVMSGLTIVTRTSHSLPVAYVPPGRDATVSYGTIDFKFSNPYDMPVKIVAVASGGVNTVSIYGTNNNPGRKISFETELIKTVPFEVKQTEDSSLPEGTVKIEQQGVNGSSYNTYKVIAENGTVISRTFLTKSNYNPTTQKELVGTGSAETEPADAIVDAEPGAETAEGEDVGTYGEEESQDVPAAETEKPEESESPAPGEETNSESTETEEPSIKPVPNALE